jgi:hypothetical protein
VKKVICNPLNLDYRYQIKKNYIDQREGVFREAADPTMLLFKNRYYLFASMSGGFWHSDDLYVWDFHETPELPVYDYAPDVREVNGKVMFSASGRDEPCRFFTSADPLNDPFQPVSAPFPFWDPNVFQDDDGRVYFYWGCSNQEPLWGIEMHPVTMQPIGEKTALLGENEANHGWERSGENNKLEEPKTEMDKMIRQYVGTKPFIEGSFMTKHNGSYYLQYAAPGTQYNVYSDGVYVSETPLGPFRYQGHNPFSSKPGGFITAAGHGSTFQDKYGNWWHIATMRISENEKFERRIGLFPCDFDTDGILYCNEHFADYPFTLPEGKRVDMDKIAPEMMLLSYNKKVSASSFQSGFEPEKGADENIRTWWAAKQAGDEWYKLDLETVYEIWAVQINFADHQHPIPEDAESAMHHSNRGGRIMEGRTILVKSQYTRFLLEGSEDGTDWFIVKDNRSTETDYTHDFIYLESSVKLRYLKVSRMEPALNGIPAISGLRVFGKGDGAAPGPVTQFDAVRPEDGLNIILRWKPSRDADGYNIRYGIAPDKMYSSWQVWGRTELDLSMVNKSMSYYIAIDSFNENAVTPGKVVFIS